MTIISRSLVDSDFDDERESQESAARQRVNERTKSRGTNEAALSVDGGVVAANTADRIARRIDRLARYYVDGDTSGVDPHRLPDLRTAMGRLRDITDESGDVGRVVEAIINTCDFIGVRYLDAGVLAARSVGRVVISGGRGFGTGFLVTPQLMLTNHHALPSIDVARQSAVEFDYQDDVNGRPLTPQRFDFDADRLYLADRDLDFALVALRATPQQVHRFGFNPLTDRQGTVVIGEFVTIVQHPRGDKKAIALRESRLVDVLDRYLHYAADTERGSSGSPVFNDQWEVVALHHASVRAPDRPDTGGVLNEGVRISQIIGWLRAQHYSTAQQDLVAPIIGQSASNTGSVRAYPVRNTEAASSAVTTMIGPFRVTVTIDGSAPPIQKDR